MKADVLDNSTDRHISSGPKGSLNSGANGSTSSGHNGNGKLKWLIPIATAGIGVVLNFVFSLSGLIEASESYNQVAANQYSVGFGYGLFFYGIVGPAIEELLFRIIGYRLLKKMFGVKWALILSALMFGVYHGNMVQGIYSFIMGILLAAGYEYSKDFKIPIASHGLTNIIVFAMTWSK